MKKENQLPLIFSLTQRVQERSTWRKKLAVLIVITQM
jgi:hypothetical protein